MKEKEKEKERERNCMLRLFENNANVGNTEQPIK